MGKMSELAMELAELKHCGEVLIGISETLTEMFSSADSEPEKAEKKTAGKKTAKPEPEKKPLTLEEVRAVLAEKSRAGHMAKVKVLLTRHGADKLSEIDPAEYPALLAEAEVL